MALIRTLIEVHILQHCLVILAYREIIHVPVWAILPVSIAHHHLDAVRHLVSVVIDCCHWPQHHSDEHGYHFSFFHVL